MFVGKIGLLLALLSWVGLSARSAPAADTTLWRIGIADNRADEFTGQTFPAEFAISGDWQTGVSWPQFPGKVSGNANRTAASGGVDTAIRFNLDQTPAHGAIFRLETVNASCLVTELAVFANDLPCGILQMVGTDYGPPNRSFGQTYQLYIPPEFLHAGANSLRLRMLGHPYDPSKFGSLGFTLDFMDLIAPSSAVDDPIHSRNVHMGVVWGEFGATPQQSAAEAKAWQWLGAAYSGNPIRVPFWADTWGDITKPPSQWGVVKDPLGYLRTARQYNMGRGTGT